MTEPRQIAVVRSYDELIAALRARASELAISRETIDAVSGLQSGYSGKLLAAVPIKGLGKTSLGPMLGALGLSLVVVEDLEMLARVRARLTESKSANAMLAARMHEVIVTKITRKKLLKLAKKGGVARANKLSKRRLRSIAKKAARARWHKPKIIEITNSADLSPCLVKEPSRKG